MRPLETQSNHKWMYVRVAISFAMIACGLVAAAEPAASAAKSPQFEEQVLPILQARCWKCHAGDKPKSGLRLTSRRDILRGGESGPAIRLAAAESSLLWARIVSNEMPAGGPPLTQQEKGILRAWINDGAPGADSGGDVPGEKPDGEPGEPVSFWAFQPPERPPLPVVRDSRRVRNGIDSWIVASLEENGLGLSEEASREVLIRRAYYDLIGLPPPPEEVLAFVSERDEFAYERLIDRLLASPQYGERWGRHWLDVAGYADSAGVLSEDRPLPTAFRYRDYVIRAFNSDKPYDRFLQEQIAGDELSNYWGAYESLPALPEEVIESLTATGYLRCAPDSSRPDFSTIKNADAQYFYPTLNDTLQIVASSTMGLTLQCARCHSHKYDPIPQVEYYRLQAIFMSALRPAQWIPQMERRLFVASGAQKKTADEHNGKLDAEINRLKKELADGREQHRAKLFEDRLATLPEQIRSDLRTAFSKESKQRNAVEAYLVEKFQSQLQPDPKTLDKLLLETYPEYKKLTEERNAAVTGQERQRIQFDELRALYDLPGPVTTPLLRRGDALTPGPLVEPGVLSALTTPVAFQWSPPAEGSKTSGRRLAFARWLTQPNHPLTSRVIVNRIWLHHFGEGIVASPEDFGAIGSRPSHPQLLDWLSREFVDSGWSIKDLHRRIMTSSTYRQSSAYVAVVHDTARQLDPDNRLLWRQRIRRLEAEPLRDAVLGTAGLLDLRQFGPPTPVARRGDGEVTPADGSADRRRSVYLQVLRSHPLTVLQAFDQPVMETNCTKRSRATVATQALTLLNSESMVNAAQALASRAVHEDPVEPIRFAILVSFSRDITPDEKTLLAEFVDSQQARYVASGDKPDSARRLAIADLCHMLLSSNEFVYID